MRDRHELANQLKDFDVRHAECQESQDRRHILHSIQRWYGSEDAFNEQVRGQVRDELLQSLPVTNMSYLAALANGSGAPVCSLLDILVGMIKGGTPTKGLTSFLLYAVAAVLFLGPTFARLFFYLAERFAAQQRTHLRDWGVSFLLFVVWEGCLVFFKGIGMLAFRRGLFESFGVAIGSAVFAWVVFSRAQLGEYRPATEGAKDRDNSNLEDDIDFYPAELGLPRVVAGGNDVLEGTVTSSAEGRE